MRKVLSQEVSVISSVNSAVLKNLPLHSKISLSCSGDFLRKCQVSKIEGGDLLFLTLNNQNMN